jgi:hypothetical protein
LKRDQKDEKSGFQEKKRGESEGLFFSLKICNLVPSASGVLDCGIAGVVME